MRDIGNWVGELTTTTGTGPITLGGAVGAMFARFEDIGITSVEYGIIDGDDREAGVGTISGGVLTRDTVYSTIVNGVYSGNSPGAIDLSGLAEVYSTFNKTAFDELQAALVKLATIENGATADQDAAEVPFTSGVGISATDVAAALDEIKGDIVAGSVDVTASYNWTGLHSYTVKPVFGGEGFVVPSELSGLAEGDDYDWTGTHTYTTRTTVNGNTVYDQGNIQEAPLGSRIVTGSTTAVLADAGGIIYSNVAGDNDVTIPPNASVAYVVGAVLSGNQMGAGQTTLVEGAGVTLIFPVSKGLLITEQGEWWSAVYQGSDIWRLAGGLTA